jgi:hypothetical protein
MSDPKKTHYVVMCFAAVNGGDNGSGMREVAAADEAPEPGKEVVPHGKSRYRS